VLAADVLEQVGGAAAVRGPPGPKGDPGPQGPPGRDADTSGSGEGSVQLGPDADAAETAAVAIGDRARAAGASTVAIGAQAEADAAYPVAVSAGGVQLRVAMPGVVETSSDGGRTWDALVSASAPGSPTNPHTDPDAVRNDALPVNWWVTSTRPALLDAGDIWLEPVA
jgi:hypothetical protein